LSKFGVTENNVANHNDNEKLSLDGCYGHGSPDCSYHYHALSNTNACSVTGTYKNCEHIGYAVDGRRIYSFCNNLKSCYKMTGTGGESTSDFTFDSS